jgi:hypothetical protein
LNGGGGGGYIRRMNRIVVVVTLAVVAGAGCKNEDRMSALAAKHRPAVDAFSARLLGVEAKLASAPATATGLTLAAGESLRVWTTTDQPANTLVIEPKTFRDVVAAHAQPGPFRNDIGPATDLELLRLYTYTYGRSDDGDQANAAKVYERVLAWYPGLRYVAVPLVTRQQNYDATSPDLVPTWVGRLAVYDLTADAWIGAVAVALEGPPLELEDYVSVDVATNRQVSGPYKLADRDVSSARYGFNNQLDAATRQALETGTAVTSVAQLQKP